MTAHPLVIHAPNIHVGGGAVLLRSLLHTIAESDTEWDCDAILDERLTIEQSGEHLRMHRFSSGLRGRWSAERRLTQLATPASRVLCFSSLPPLFRCPGRISVFVQNRNIISAESLANYPRGERWKAQLQRTWFQSRHQNAHEYIVQTQTMADLLEQRLGSTARIRIHPFLPQALPVESDPSERPATVPFVTRTPNYDYCYVATGEPHKNHRALIQAWGLLARQGLFPSLCLTLDRQNFRELCEWIDAQSQQHGLRVKNLGYVSRDEVDQLYRSCRCLVFPSQYESFGMPLLEAQAQGLTIIAAERDYVRDVVQPAESFDPDSPRSIARAVARHLQATPTSETPGTPQQFLQRLFAA